MHQMMRARLFPSRPGFIHWGERHFRPIQPVLPAGSCTLRPKARPEAEGVSRRELHEVVQRNDKSKFF